MPESRFNQLALIAAAAAAALLMLKLHHANRRLRAATDEVCIDELLHRMHPDAAAVFNASALLRVTCAVCATRVQVRRLKGELRKAVQSNRQIEVM
jgi:hypothetical protein